mgnify:CR=1 FL=1
MSFVRDEIEQSIMLERIDTNDNQANILTKSLTAVTFIKFRENLGLKIVN